MAGQQQSERLTIIVEHLDPELEAWQALEYQCIAAECAASNTGFMLSGLSSAADVTQQLSLPPNNLSERSVETIYIGEQRSRVCLLDPKAEQDLAPEDAALFDVFLFGGILGDDPPRGTMWPPMHYDVGLTRMIQDRTGELRKMGFEGRRLGPEQMTTDTAARVARLVILEGKRLDEIPYVDRPDIALPPVKDAEGRNLPSESVSMPFKYVKGDDGKPVMPKGMLDLLASDADKDILDLL